MTLVSCCAALALVLWCQLTGPSAGACIRSQSHTDRDTTWSTTQLMVKHIPGGEPIQYTGVIAVSLSISGLWQQL